MHRVLRVVPILATLLTLTPPSGAQTPIDLSGDWHLDTNVTTVVVNVPSASFKGTTSCTFQGTATLTQTGTDVSGPMTVHLVNGPVICPPTMSGNMNGHVTGSRLDMGMVMGDNNLGEVTFNGTIVQAATRVAAATTTISGSFTVTTGPFAGSAGTWNAMPGTAPPFIPTQSTLGLALLALAVLGAGIFLLRR